ncbi:MAG: hypothetical protein JKY52_15085 [Flavobacteriales bacterium]|nr:hypothetical protein [Flavobacteriales bacterium]
MIFNSSLKQATGFLGVLSLICFSSCNNGTEPVTEADSNNIDVEKVKAKPEAKEEFVYYMLPSALQIAHIFRKSGLKYYPNVINDPNNVSKYVSETSKLQNIGVFSADLCYAALNQQTQEELNCLKAMMDLSGEMGFSSVFTGAFVDRFEKNIAHEDSMISILTELQKRLDYYLQDAEMNDQSIIIFSGAWVESIYLSLAGYRAEGDVSGLSVRIQEQLYILKGLISKLNDVWEPDEQVKALTSDLEALLTIVEDLSFITNVDPKEQVSVSEVAISDEEIKLILKTVDKIRATVVNG